MGGRRSRRLAIRALRAELVVAEDALFAAAREVQADGGGPRCRRGGAASTVSVQCARHWPQWWTSSSVSEMVYFFNSLTYSV